MESPKSQEFPPVAQAVPGREGKAVADSLQTCRCNKITRDGNQMICGSGREGR